LSAGFFMVGLAIVGWVQQRETQHSPGSWSLGYTSLHPTYGDDAFLSV
jgi:hypothetical protein